MTPFKWSKELSVKIEEIDAQHKKLIFITNKLFYAMQEGQGRIVLENIVDEVTDYADYHFTIEEEYMIKAEYQSLEEHRIEHKKFISDLRTIQKNLHHNVLNVSLNTFDFLKNWIKNHILGTDKLYVNCLHEHGME